MSDASAGKGGFNQASSAAGGHNPWLIAVVVSIATFMEVLDTTIANVALLHIAGGLAAGQDQATWVITSYLVANAVVLSISGWLATVIGRKRFYMICVALFTVSSLLCGLAWSLESLIFFRILQGIGGGGMAPSEQSILADSFPPELRGRAFAVYGVAVVVAPAIGPTLGGWLTDTYSWHWVFLINVPMGILSLILVHFLVSEPSSTEKDRKRLLKNGVRFDFVGFILVALGLGCLEVVLDRGQEDDWFDSNMITSFAVVSGLSLLLLIPWELARKEPIVEVGLLFRRQFGTCFLIMLGAGGIIIGTTQFMPQLLQEEFDYTATLAGLAMSPGGIAAFLMMPLAGRLTDLFQPKYLIMAGTVIMAVAMWRLTELTPDLTFGYVAWTRIILALGLPIVFLPITTASYAGLEPSQTNQASALINVARNLGGSIVVSMSQTVLAQREQFHQSRLVESVSPTNPNYQRTFDEVRNAFVARGANPSEAGRQTTEWIGGQVQTQTHLLAYIDVFWTLAIVALVLGTLAFLFLSHVDKGKAQAGH